MESKRDPAAPAGEEMHTDTDKNDFSDRMLEEETFGSSESSNPSDMLKPKLVRKELQSARQGTLMERVSDLPPPEVQGSHICAFLFDDRLDKSGFPWRQPEADPKDYFNYGFTEETWRMYCVKRIMEDDALSEYRPLVEAIARAAERGVPQ